jgi:methyl halide transferase
MGSTAEPSLSQRFASAPPDPAAHAAIWSSCYRDDFHPWDRAGPSLALADLLDQRPDLVPPAQEHDARGRLTRDESGAAIRSTALVPGCGLGHDALILAARGYDVWALDVSPEAIEQARRNEAAAQSDAVYSVPQNFERGSITWVTGDFFADAWATDAGTEGSGKFDLIFDYTVS